MFHCESDLLANLVVLSPKVARKQFRESIFQDWNWQCAYCDRQLNEGTATIDHIVPKHKGGHNTRNNLACACSNCNKAKGSQSVFDYMNVEHRNYSEQRVAKIQNWMEQKPCSMKITSSEKEDAYSNNGSRISWAVG
jgi:CRISPR/Cas system Type II protein with McrA/HNH and RuvC-like nuclease domain